MKTKIIGAGLAVALATGSAVAADMNRGRYNAPVYTPPAAYSWAGPYIGGNFGYQWGDTTNNPTEPSGILGGVQGGYNWQFGQFVVGAETDFQFSNADDTFAAWKFSNPWFGTFRLRGGYAMDNILLYATGGFAYGRLEGERAGISENRTGTGYAVGLGMEVGLTQNWTARAEYLHMDLGDKLFQQVTAVENGFESNLLRLGVNYRF
jgi:outer membrane immunogenic protein